MQAQWLEKLLLRHLAKADVLPFIYTYDVT